MSNIEDLDRLTENIKTPRLKTFAKLANKDDDFGYSSQKPTLYEDLKNIKREYESEPSRGRLLSY